MTKQRRTFSPEFKQQAAGLVLDQGYNFSEASRSVGVHDLFIESRSSAGSRSIMGMMREEGTAIGRFKVSRLMEELG